MNFQLNSPSLFIKIDKMLPKELEGDRNTNESQAQLGFLDDKLISARNITSASALIPN